MPDTRFIFDRTEQETAKTVEEILRVIQKKPYPDDKTTHLATFIHAMFQVSPRTKSISMPQAQPQISPDAKLIQAAASKPLPPAPRYAPPKIVAPKPVVIPVAIPVQPMAETGLLAKEQTMLPSMPEAPSAVFRRKEYAITSFNTQVGVLMDNDDSGKPAYKVSEPAIKEDVLKLTKGYIESDFEKDFQVLDNPDYINKKVEKACKKSDVPYTDDYAKAVVYYLKRDLLGFRRVDALMYDTNVTGVYCDGINKPVLVEIKDFGKIPTNIIFTDVIDLNALLFKIAKAAGAQLGEANPILDTEFQGYRIQAVLGIGGMSSKLIIKK